MIPLDSLQEQPRLNTNSRFWQILLSQIDNVLIFGWTKEEHNTRLTMALEKICSAGVTINIEKCLFGQDSLKSLGTKMES